MKTEKERRIYYQDIVYQVCHALDLIDGKEPGHGIVCDNVVDRMKQLVLEVQPSHKEPKEMRAGSPNYQNDADIINGIFYEIRNSGNIKPCAHLYLGYKQVRALNTIAKGDPQELKNNRFCGFSIVVVEKEYWCKLLA